MANKISDETLDYISVLSKLELSESERQQAKQDLSNMLDYFGTLNELDTEGVTPMSHIYPIENVFREDEITNGDERDAILANAPERREDCFVVPKTTG